MSRIERIIKKRLNKEPFYKIFEDMTLKESVEIVFYRAESIARSLPRKITRTFSSIRHGFDVSDTWALDAAMLRHLYLRLEKMLEDGTQVVIYPEDVLEDFRRIITLCELHFESIYSLDGEETSVYSDEVWEIWARVHRYAWW